MRDVVCYLISTSYESDELVIKLLKKLSKKYQL